MSGQKLNAAFNILQGIQAFRRDEQDYANDIAQQRINNREAVARGQLAINALGVTNALQRRKVAFDFLEAQKRALQSEGSALANAAWQGIQGGTAHDILVAVEQEAAQAEVLRDEGLRAIYEESRVRASDIVMQTEASMDLRNFTKPDVLAGILGIGQNILADNREAGLIG